jgi:hypothetical protein
VVIADAADWAAWADAADWAEEFAEPEGRAVAEVAVVEATARDACAADACAAEACAAEACAADVCAAEVWALDRCEADRTAEAAVAEGWPGCAGPVAGLNVATDSMAPATRQTARMLASSGITVPCPANGLVSRRSRRRRRRARNSR